MKVQNVLHWWMYKVQCTVEYDGGRVTFLEYQQLPEAHQPN